MKKRDASDFLQEVLEELDGLPEGFKERLNEIVKSTATPTKDDIRELIVEVTRV